MDSYMWSCQGRLPKKESKFRAAKRPLGVAACEIVESAPGVGPRSGQGTEPPCNSNSSNTQKHYTRRLCNHSYIYSATSVGHRHSATLSPLDYTALCHALSHRLHASTYCLPAVLLHSLSLSSTPDWMLISLSLSPSSTPDWMLISLTLSPSNTPIVDCGSPIQGVNVNTPEQELKSIESTATSIETTLDKNLERATPNENAALTKIQAMTSSYSHPSNAWRNYEVMLSSEIEWTQHKLRASLCNQYYQFKKFIAERPPVDATLREWINSAEYKSKTVFPHLEAEIIAPANRLLPVPELETKSIAEKKRFFTRRVRELTHANDQKMEAFEKGAKSVLDALYNAVLTSSGMDRDLKGDLSRPYSIEEKADVIQLGLNIGDDLNCPRPKI
ncbi:unnamed protein product [Bemisia tabaci]|uniref:Uncharacterized protein n=1 Tax=Bemisia tabaci TaxID=7038 RepID=A0A9P0ALI3_BEMTA|nr:unnamed protein product [Bemisia tabaci]